jgi:hypothetical protein
VLLNGKVIKNGFPYPMAIAALGQGFSAVASYVCCKVGQRSSHAYRMYFHSCPLAPIDGTALSCTPLQSSRSLVVPFL